MKTILAADSCQEVGVLLQSVLEDKGYQVILTHSLTEATRLLSTRHVDAIITEAFDQDNLFDFDPTFLYKLKALAGDAPIIVMFIRGAFEGMCAGDFGLADILPMPFDLEELLQKVSRVLDRGEPAEGRGLEHPATSSMAA